MQDRLTRRSLLSACAGLLPMAGAVAAPKRSKASVAYQDKPKGINMCATCTLFRRPKSCVVVEGAVTPKGWCNLFAFVD